MEADDCSRGWMQQLEMNVRMVADSLVVWLSGIVVRMLDLRLEIAGSIPAAALSSATFASCSHTFGASLTQPSAFILPSMGQ